MLTNMHVYVNYVFSLSSVIIKIIALLFTNLPTSLLQIADTSLQNLCLSTYMVFHAIMITNQS